MKHGNLNLSVALLLSLFAMWALSMSMIVDWDHYSWNASNAYMGATMVMVMGLIMLGVMWSVFLNRLLNLGLGAVFLAVFGLVFCLGRQEAGVGNEAFAPWWSRTPAPSSSARSRTAPTGTSKRSAREVIEVQREELAQMQRILDE